MFLRAVLACTLDVGVMSVKFMTCRQESIHVGKRNGKTLSSMDELCMAQSLRLSRWTRKNYSRRVKFRCFAINRCLQSKCMRIVTATSSGNTLRARTYCEMYEQRWSIWLVGELAKLETRWSMECSAMRTNDEILLRRNNQWITADWQCHRHDQSTGQDKREDIHLVWILKDRVKTKENSNNDLKQREVMNHESGEVLVGPQCSMSFCFIAHIVSTAAASERATERERERREEKKGEQLFKLPHLFLCSVDFVVTFLLEFFSHSIIHRYYLVAWRRRRRTIAYVVSLIGNSCIMAARLMLVTNASICEAIAQKNEGCKDTEAMFSINNSPTLLTVVYMRN